MNAPGTSALVQALTTGRSGAPIDMLSLVARGRSWPTGRAPIKQ
jgi:hypothetical protein